MREILFRGKNKYGKWYYGYYTEGYYLDGTPVSWIEVVDRKKKDTECPTVIPETVGQYTGLTDKNGKKIFEGDIVDVMHQGVYACRWAEGNFEFGPVNENESFGIAYVSPNDISVIGNIHDNPELLEEAIR